MYGIILIGIFLIGNSLYQKSLDQFSGGVILLSIGILLHILLKNESRIRSYLERNNYFLD